MKHSKYSHLNFGQFLRIEHFLLIAGIVVSLLVSGPMLAQQTALPDAPADASVTTLLNVESESDSAMSIVTATLSLAPKWRKLAIEDHGSFVQITLPGTIIPKPGTFFAGAGNYVKKAAVFQANTTDGALRIFTSVSAALVRDVSSVEVLGERVIVTIDHKKLPAIGATAEKKKDSAAADVASAASTKSTTTPATVATASATSKTESIDPALLPAFEKIKVPSADQVVQNVQVNNDIPAPSEILASSPTKALAPETPVTPANSETDAAAPAAVASVAATSATPANEAPSKPVKSIGQNVPDLSGKLTGVAIFSGVMLVLFGILYLLKPALRKRRGGQSGAAELTMKTLATMPLASRQKLALVQVAGEQILLAISPDNVNFITTIGPSTNVSAAQRGRAVEPARLSGGAPAATLSQFTKALAGTDADDAIEARRRPIVTRSSNQILPAAKRASAPTERVGNTKSPSEPSLERRRGINVAIGDEGITKIDAPSVNSGAARRTEKSARVGASGGTTGTRGSTRQDERPLDDITKIIREKLKNLPPV